MWCSLLGDLHLAHLIPSILVPPFDTKLHDRLRFLNANDANGQSIVANGDFLRQVDCLGHLIDRARMILGTDQVWPAALVGAGNLGRALVAYRGFARKGFEIVAVLDRDASIIGRPLPDSDGLTVLPVSTLPQVVPAKNIRIGIIAVPAPEAQLVADLMLQAGGQGIVNFAPVALDVPPGVPVSAIDLAIHFEQVAFQVAESAD